MKRLMSIVLVGCTVSAYSAPVSLLPANVLGLTRELNQNITNSFTNYFTGPMSPGQIELYNRMVRVQANRMNPAGLVQSLMVLDNAYSMNYRRMSGVPTMPVALEPMIKSHCNWFSAQVQVDLLALTEHISIAQLESVQIAGLDQIPHDVTYTNSVRQARSQAVRYYGQRVNPVSVRPEAERMCLINPKAYGAVF
jgi:hypothetical protein